MKNTLILIFFVLFTTGCSNIGTREYNVTNQEKASLITLITEVKRDLEYGDYEEFEKLLVPSIRNSMLKNLLEDIDFSKIKIFTSNPTFDKNKAKNIVGLLVAEQTIYFDVEYLLEKGKWKILKFKEKRG